MSARHSISPNAVVFQALSNTHYQRIINLRTHTPLRVVASSLTKRFWYVPADRLSMPVLTRRSVRQHIQFLPREMVPNRGRGKEPKPCLLRTTKTFSKYSKSIRYHFSVTYRGKNFAPHCVIFDSPLSITYIKAGALLMLNCISNSVYISKDSNSLMR